ncbi:MAG: hypothetical protein QOE70_3038 [Chthoniobacter sp.]|jgi:hypothetical protein|nr:hypothetical protein [Chthoniobacter sp.]
MRVRLCLSLLALGTALASATDEGAFDYATAPRAILVRPPGPPADSLLQATIEPTKRELRFDDVLAAERWEQNFALTTRLPIDESFSLRQEFRAGMQSESVLGNELSIAFRDALAVLEKTAAELRVSEAWRLEASIQEQRLANNSIPFAEIVTYGAEAKFAPAPTTAVKLQLELQQRDEFTAGESAQDTWRLALEQDLVPKLVKASAGVSMVHFVDAQVAERESLAEKFEWSLKWSPIARTALLLGAERTSREALTLSEAMDSYAVKLQQQLFGKSKIELQAGYESHLRTALEPILPDAVWSLGANSDFAVHEDWNAGLGVRYRLREEPALLTPADELSLTLSLKGRF